MNPGIFALLALVPLPAFAQLLPADLVACGLAPVKGAAEHVVALVADQPAKLSWPRLVPGKYFAMLRESGVDAKLRMELPHSDNAAFADSPVRRQGSQLISFEYGAVTDAHFNVVGKDGGSRSARVTAGIYLVTTKVSEPCEQSLRALAEGDRHYAAAENLVRHPREDSTAEAAAAYVSATEAYLRALASAERSGVAALVAHAELALASVYYQGRQRWSDSRDLALRAANSFVKLERPYYVARAEGMAGAAMLETSTSATTGDGFASARQILERAAMSHHSRHEAYDEGLQRTNVGLSHFYASEFPACIVQMQSAIKLFRNERARHRVALAEQNIAMCEWGLGNLRQASQIFERIIPVLRDAPLQFHYALALNNAALVHFALGEFDRSLILHSEAERHAARLGLPRERAQSLYGLGVTYAALGDFSTAESFLRQSLAVRTPQLDGRGRVASLRAIASILDSRHAPDPANLLDREALALSTSPLTKYKIETRVIAREIAARRITPALRERVARLVAGAEGADREVRAQARLLRAGLAVAQDQVAAAFADFDQARQEFADLENIEGEYDACMALARFAHEHHNFVRAAPAIECATGLANQMRAQVLNPELRANVSQLRREAAQLEVRIAVDSPGEPATRALNVLGATERHRARLLDDYSAGMGLGAERQLPDLRRLYDDLAATRYQLNAVQTRGGSETERATQLRSRLSAQRVEILRLEETLRGERAQDSSRTLSLREFVAGIPADTVVVSYWLDPRKSLAVIASRGELSLVELAGAATIDAAVAALRESLGNISDRGPTRRMDAARALSKLVIAPLDLPAAHWRQIVFVADGSLHYVPMPALCVDSTRCDRVMIESFVVANAPSMRWLARSAAQTSAHYSGRALVVADPIYEANDPRLQNGRRAVGRAGNPPPLISQLRGLGNTAAPLRRLPGSAAEAAQLTALFPRGSVDLLSGREATRGKVLDRDLSQYEFLHFAVHGLTDSEFPQLSALALSKYTGPAQQEDGRLWAGDLLQRRLNARLVFLSACDTALGAQFAGEGLVGLKYILLARGARNVIASLWPVEDVTTAELATETFRRIRAGSTVPEALGGAQRMYLKAHEDHDLLRWSAWSATMSGIATN